jgi:hypothetical protein
MSKPKEKQYIKLDLQDFKCLVGGGVLKVGDLIRICLSDIGFEAMDDAIVDAMIPENQYKDHQKTF